MNTLKKSLLLTLSPWNWKRLGSEALHNTPRNTWHLSYSLQQRSHVFSTRSSPSLKTQTKEMAPTAHPLNKQEAHQMALQSRDGKEEERTQQVIKPPQKLKPNPSVTTATDILPCSSQHSVDTVPQHFLAQRQRLMHLHLSWQSKLQHLQPDNSRHRTSRKRPHFLSFPQRIKHAIWHTKKLQPICKVTQNEIHSSTKFQE